MLQKITINKFSLLSFLCIAFLFSGKKLMAQKTANEDVKDIVQLENVDPLQKVFKETAFFESIDPVADVARGEHASFQLALRSSKKLNQVSASVMQLSRNKNLFAQNTFIGFVGYTRVGRPLPDPPKFRLNPESGFYPDPILDASSLDIPAFCTQPIWITVNIPENTASGNYVGMIEVKGFVDNKPFLISKRISIKVYPVTINKTSLWVTNWFGLGKNQLKQLSGGKDSVEFVGNYWKWLRVAAKKMKEYNQNVIMTPVLSLTKFTHDGDKINFDFGRLDQFLQTFSDEGCLGRIEGGHIGGRMGNWYAQFGVAMPYWKNDSLKWKTVSIKDNAAQDFYKQFIPALMTHLKEKGWDKIYMQHIADEPEEGNGKTYSEIASFIKSIAPEIKIIEAVHSHNVENTIDVWVPQLDFFDKDNPFYEERKKAGNEIWFYTCLAPQGEYANRFIELPLIKTRILHWINYKYGATGYLHWGWNFWNANCFQESSGIIPEAGNVMPGGDMFITYPAPGKILSSIRLEAMRDGIVDYELLKMLAQKNSAMAKEICRQVVYEFTRYDVDVKSFREKRKRILEELGK